MIFQCRRDVITKGEGREVVLSIGSVCHVKVMKLSKNSVGYETSYQIGLHSQK